MLVTKRSRQPRFHRARSPLPVNSDKLDIHCDQACSEFPGRGAGGEGIYVLRISARSIFFRHRLRTTLRKLFGGFNFRGIIEI